MNAFITSFHLAHGLGVPTFSAAVYQPQGLDYPKAEWADIRGPDGKWIRPREFVGVSTDPLRSYHEALTALYKGRWHQIHEWLERTIFRQDFALLCWCPYERAAQRQLEEHGSYVCHTAVVGEILERDHGVRVWYDGDRRLMKALP